MIDLDFGGACPRQPLTLALLQGLGMPVEPGPGPDAFSIGTLDHPSEAALEMVARAAMATRQDSLLALFADQRTSHCGGLALIYRNREGVNILQVEPCLPQHGRPMILVTRDRTRAFGLDERFILTARTLPSSTKIERGIDRAWIEIKAAMRTLEVDPDAWECGDFAIFGDARAMADFLA